MIDADGLHRIGPCQATYEHAKRTLEIAISAQAITPEKRRAVEAWIERERKRHEKVLEMVREIKNKG